MAKVLLVTSWILMSSASTLHAQQYVVSTIAGAALPMSGGATSVSVGNPVGLATDASGDVYFSSNSAVFKLDGNGVLTRIAGNSKGGYSGDQGLALNARLNFPHVYPNDSSGYGEIWGAGIAVDNVGNLFIADVFNNRIRRVGRNGIITTVAGKSISDASDIGSANSAEATNTYLDWPENVAADTAGNFYIGNRKVTPEGIVTTIDFGRCIFDGFRISGGVCANNGMALDAANNLFIADAPYCRIYKISPDGNITSVAGDTNPSRPSPAWAQPWTCGYSGDGGPATSAALRSPFGVHVDGSGNLYIADTSNSCIRKVTVDGIIDTVAGTCGYRGNNGDGGPAKSAQLNLPRAVAVDRNGNLYISDSGNNRVRKVTPDGIITTAAGNGLFNSSGDHEQAKTAQIDLLDSIYKRAGGVAVDVRGNVYFSEPANHRVRKVDVDGTITTVAGTGDLGYSGDGDEATRARLFAPSRLSFDAAGNLLIADGGNSRIRTVTPDGIIDTVRNYSWPLTAPLGFPYGGAVDAAGTTYFADCCTLQKISSNGVRTTIAAIPPNPPYLSPLYSYVSYNPFPCDWGDVSCGVMRSVVLDESGNIYFHNSTNIYRLSRDGALTNIAGNGSHGYSGDGGPATDAQFSFISAIAAGLGGDLYVADAGNNAIRLLRPISAVP